MIARPRHSANQESSFRVRFWGVRGSYPTTGSNTRAFGGNTSCVEVTAGNRRLIFDAGTGIIRLGKELCDGAGPTSANYVFLSHTHIDHVMGLCFFEPLLTPSARSFILGPGTGRGALTRSLRHLTHSHLFPVSLDELKGKKDIISLGGGETIRFGAPGRRPKIETARASSGDRADELVITTCKSSAHPLNGVLLYRVDFKGKSLVYATDIEQQNGGYPEIIEFARGVDLLIHDAQYLHDEYTSQAKPRKGWGHSTINMAAEVARNAQVKRLVLFHHEPTHDDETMRIIARQAARLFRSTVVAAEGMQIDLLS
ncbi:MAG TPA: MBL fold metallo-hydrolase [Candidatus Limnocylindria bacterium]|nr:MBL fold metallo-hydrolase [Candidatus Limnocylindria bacterium]